MRALAPSSLRMATWMLRLGASARVYDTHGRSPLHVATKVGGAASAHTVALLLHAGADPNGRDHQGTCIACACVDVCTCVCAGACVCAYHHLYMCLCVALLIHAWVAGNTPLTLAAAAGATATVRLLLRAGAEADEAVHVAIKAGQHDAMAALFAHGASVSYQVTDTRTHTHTHAAAPVA
jgi:hypothetical protein